MKPGDLITPTNCLVHFFDNENFLDWEYLNDCNLCTVLETKNKSFPGIKINVSKVLTTNGIFWVYTKDIKKIEETN